MEATAAIIQPIVESVRSLHPPKLWDDISPQFLVTFWSLSMYDLEVPNDSYAREIQKLKKQSLIALDSKEMVTLESFWHFLLGFHVVVFFVSIRIRRRFEKSKNVSLH